jgi:flagellar protein FlaG
MREAEGGGMQIDSLHSVGQPLATASAPLAPDKLSEHRELIQAVKALNAAELFGQNQELTFAVDRETRRPVVRIVDRKTNEVIRQIPPELVLRLAQDLSLLRGEK